MLFHWNFRVFFLLFVLFSVSAVTASPMHRIKVSVDVETEGHEVAPHHLEEPIHDLAGFAESALSASGKDKGKSHSSHSSHPTVGNAWDMKDSDLPLYKQFHGADAAGHPVLGGLSSGVSAHYGIDISHYQTVTNAAAAVAALKKKGNGATPFVFVKATEGSSSVDPTTKSALAAFRSAGAVVGAYLFLHPKQAISSQVTNFVEHDFSVKIVIVDSEVTDGTSMANAMTQTKAALTALGPGSWVYLNKDWFTHFTAMDKNFPWGHHVWLAQYSKAPSEPCLVWQYDENGSLPGISGDGLDMDVFLGTEEMWNQFIVNASPSMAGGADPWPTSDKCKAIDGICIDTAKSPCHGTAHGSLCSGISTVKCCVSDAPAPNPTPNPTPNPNPNPTPSPESSPKCAALNGHCLDSATNSCSNGVFIHGQCNGGASTMCCVPTNFPSSSCSAHNGVCMDTSSAHCSGHTLSHLCPGPASVVCCAL